MTRHQCEFLPRGRISVSGPGICGAVRAGPRSRPRAGLIDVDRNMGAPASSFDTNAASHFPRQGQFTRKYLSGRRTLQSKGGKIYTKYARFADRRGKRGASRHRRRADVVKSTAVSWPQNAPVNDLVAIHTKQAPYLTT